MFIKLIEWLGTQNNLKVPHRGYVKDNFDPLKLRRVRVTIPGVLEGETNSLPWIYPVAPYFLGGKSDVTIVSIPEVTSELEIIFPYDDINFGYYVGYWESAPYHNALFNIDYPESYGYLDSTHKIGNWMRTNKSDGFIDIHHHSGTHIQIEDSGTINIYSVKDINIKADRDITIHAGRNIETKSIVDTKMKIMSNLEVKTEGFSQHITKGPALVKSEDSLIIIGHHESGYL